jgi:error-prone DNA polymerase
MSYCRDEMNRLGVTRATDLERMRNGVFVKIAGCVIARQRPGTAKGFVFLSLEDETGIANAILEPEVFQRNRYTIVDGKFLLLEGRLQNVDNVISVKVSKAEKLSVSKASTVSHDFH